MDLKNKVAVITGVSRGIGLATLKLLLSKGMTVVGWGRTKPNVEDKNFHFFRTDIRYFTAVEKSYHKTVELIRSDIHVLINNAGVGFVSRIELADVEEWKEMFDTNVHGLFYCSKAVVPKMKEMEMGHIINIASIAATTGIPQMAGYCATKHAVRGISQSMYKELREFGIKVTTIYPGSTKTNFFDNIAEIDANDNMMMPDDIAATILHVLETPDNYHHVDIEVRPLRPKGKS